ncbi:MAG: class I SAM-dependent methyltransferase [Candidatus Binatia bacterium]
MTQKPPRDTDLVSDPRPAAVLTAYEARAAHFNETDPRDQYTYLYSKMRCDYTLMERIGVDNKDVLNIGCSFPIDELYYARKVRRWTAVDISPASLRAAQAIVANELHPQLAAKFTFQYGDACALPFANDTFDLTLSMSTFDHLPSAAMRQKAVDEMARTTKSEGYVIVTVANWWCLPFAAGIWKMSREKTLPYGYAYLFSPPEIRRIGIQAGLIPQHFASSLAPPDVWLPGYPVLIRWPAHLLFQILRFAGYLGRRIGYAFLKP